MPPSSIDPSFGGKAATVLKLIIVTFHALSILNGMINFYQSEVTYDQSPKTVRFA